MKTIRFLLIVVFAASTSLVALAAQVHVPKQVTAGNDLSVRTSGNGDGTLLLLGPGYASRHKVKLGDTVKIAKGELKNAGRYMVVLKSDDGNASADFFVTAGSLSDIAFLAQPSRVPAARRDVISGTALAMDRYDNLVTTPTTVKFELAVPGTKPEVETAKSKDGVAWVRMGSGSKEGPAQFVASVGDVSVKRVVQQVAAEPCNIRMHAQRTKDSIVVQTDPIRDCSGNPVPDGTIVTFTQQDPNGKSTVDARIKRGIAKAELPLAPKATISVASGVVVGNEIQWRGGE